MPDYRVVPAALRAVANGVGEVAGDWEAAATCLNHLGPMRMGELGLLGDIAGVPGAYDEALAVVLGFVRRGQAALTTSADALDVVAADYERREFCYYRRFGYLDKGGPR